MKRLQTTAREECKEIIDVHTVLFFHHMLTKENQRRVLPIIVIYARSARLETDGWEMKSTYTTSTPHLTYSFITFDVKIFQY